MGSIPEDLHELIQHRLEELGKQGPFAVDKLSNHLPKGNTFPPSRDESTRSGTYPARLENGEVFWVRFDPPREAREGNGVGISEQILGTEEAAIAALVATEPPIRIADVLRSHEPVQRADRRVELWPKAWDEAGFADGTTFSEVMHRLPNLDPGDDVFERRYLKQIKALLRYYRDNFDDLPFDEQLALIQGAERYVENFQKSLKDLSAYLEYGSPGRDLRTAVESADRDVRAAISKDVYGQSFLGVAEELDLPITEMAREKKR